MAEQTTNREITLGITGASGAIYAISLIKALCHHYQRIHVMMTDAARIVFASELDIQIPQAPVKIAEKLAELTGANNPGDDSDQVCVYSKENWYSPVASGSAAPKQMVICPASMGCISAIATGASNNLLERAADVVLKEKGQLILIPREMPFSTIHLRNLLALSEAGATIMPAAPGFYHQPQSIAELADFVVARILSHLGLDSDQGPRWGYRKN